MSVKFRRVESSGVVEECAEEKLLMRLGKKMEGESQLREKGVLRFGARTSLGALATLHTSQVKHFTLPSQSQSNRKTTLSEEIVT